MEDIKIPAMAIPPATDGERDLIRKQMGCMNGILQLFDRHYFITGRVVSSHNHKRLLQGAEHPLGLDKTENGPELQKEKPRMSTESSRPSCSSSTCSTSTFSSIDCVRIAQPDTLSPAQINISEGPIQIIETKEQQPPLTKTMRPFDIRNIVKDSMYREARSLSIKHLATGEIRCTVMKHIDSPRPSLQFKSGKPKANCNEGLPPGLVKNSKEERVALTRLSYDGRESRETVKWSMKHKELPRLSLDGKSRSLKGSASASKLHFPGQFQAPPSNQAPGSHQQSSSIVAKLMGLEMLQRTISSDEGGTQTSSSCRKEAFLSNSRADKGRQNPDTYSSRALKGYPGTSLPRLHNANCARKPTTCSKLPAERAPWRQPDRNQGSLPTTSQSTKATRSTSHLSSSVYGEIGKRITQLEFKHSGKDLQALNKILEDMENTRRRLENHRGETSEFALLEKCSLEDSHSAQDSIKLLMGENVQSCHRVSTVKGPCRPRQLGSSNLTMKPDKMRDKVSLSTQAPKMEISQLQRLQAQAPLHHQKEVSAHKLEKLYAPKSNNAKSLGRHLPFPQKKTTCRTLEVKKTTGGPHCMIAENSSNSGRSFGMASTRVRQSTLRIEEQSHPIIPFSDSHGFIRQSSKKLIEKGSQNRKHNGRAKDLQLNDDQFSGLSSSSRGSSYQGDITSVKSGSNNSELSQTEREVMTANPSYENARPKEKVTSIRRKSIGAVENVATLLDQPSPSSVLDDIFYNEDSPSPVEKTSTRFKDESLDPGEDEWDLKNSKHSTACRRLDHSCRLYNQKLTNMKTAACELSFLSTELDKANGNGYPDRTYITKILSTSGLLKYSNIFSMSDRLLHSCHLINPDIFHVIEQAENIIDLKNDNMQLNKKLQRRIIFDLVDEILVKKIHSGRYTMGKKSRSQEALLKEVYLEIDRVCETSIWNLDNANEAMKTLLTTDTLYQSEDWADWSGEFPALVLDVERQIFKDLINEVISGEVRSDHDQPKKHCRQLFNQ